MIYLDYVSNTPASPAVIQRFGELERTIPYNPNTDNPLAKESARILVDARKRMGHHLGIDGDDLIFTSTATEANNLAIKGLARGYRSKGKHIITTYLEHSSVNGAVGALIAEGYEVDFVDLEHGRVDMDELEDLLRPDTVLVALCHVDGEVGVIQDIEAIGQLIKEESKAFFHVDGTQAVGKIPVDLSHVDSYAFAAHKFYGLNNSAGLYLRKGHIIEPLHHGGKSLSPYRSGTPSLSLIDTMALAMDEAYDELEHRTEHVRKLNDQLRIFLKDYKAVQINTPDDGLPHIINISFDGIKGEQFRDLMAHEGFYVSTKPACSGKNTPSRPVHAVTGNRKASMSTLRISLSHLTTEAELKSFMMCFNKVYNELGKQ